MNPLRKSKKQYFNNINVRNVTEKKSFWKSVNLYISKKGSRSKKITLIENDPIITSDKVISKTMNKFFIYTTKKQNQKQIKNDSDTDINQITSVFKNHASIRKIQECLNFRQVSLKEVKSEVLNLNITK